jgi:hypothetical protein
MLGKRFDEHPIQRQAGVKVALIVIAVMATLSLLLGFIDIVFFRIGSLTLLSLFCLCVILVSQNNDPMYHRISPNRRHRREGDGDEPERRSALGWFLKFIGLVFIALGYVVLSFWGGILILLGSVAIVVGYRLCLRSWHPGELSDRSPPILFLRGFDDDGLRSFQPTNWLARFHGFFNVRFGNLRLPSLLWFIHPIRLLKMFLNMDTYYAEEVFRSAFKRYGPFVAIGKPGEPLATPGAERMYVPDEAWQAVVLDTLKRCQFVVLQPSESAGIRWEIERVFTHVPQRRVLLSLVNFLGQPNKYLDFRSWLAASCGVRLPVAVAFHDTPCFVYFGADGKPRLQLVCYHSPLVWSFLGSAVDSSRTFYGFIQGLQGGTQDLPLQPKQYPGHGVLSILIALGIMLFFGHSSPIPTTQGRGVRGLNSGGARVSRGFSPLAPGQAGGAKTVWASKRVVTLNFFTRSNLRRNAVGMSEKCRFSPGLSGF